jgi:dTDP-glucose pyrophosphorylase
MVTFSLNKYFVKPNATINEILNKISIIKKKIIFVGKNNQISGVITDGDLRNAIIKKKNKASAIMNKNFIFAYNKENINNKKLNPIIKYVPIIDSKRRLISIYEVNNNNLYTNDVVIIAGGKGERLMPLTKELPKPMLMINGKPHLETLLLNLKKSGFKNIHLCLGFKSKIIINYFKNKKIKFNFTVEKKKLGTAGAIANINSENKLPKIIINADLVSNINLESMLLNHIKSRAHVSIAVKKHIFDLPYAYIKIVRNEIINIKEKPSHEYLFNTGIYILNDSVLGHIKKNKYLDMPTLINKLIFIKKKIIPFYVYEDWVDFGEKNALIKLDKKYKKILSKFK